MESVDPAWLYATLAQSAAAIVAIVGGFLVSRIVSMSAERSGIRRQYDEVRDALDVRLEQLQDVYSWRRSVSVEWFRDWHLQDLVDRSGKVSPEELLSEWLPLGSDAEEMRSAAQALVTDVLRAIEQVRELADRGIRPSSADGARKAGLEIPKEQEEVFEAVIEKLAPKSQSGDPYGFLVNPIDLNVSESGHEVARQEDRIREEARLAGDVDQLRVQLERLELEQRAFELPTAMWWGVGILASLAIVGVILPVSILASRPIPDTLAWRRTAVVLFVSGILAHLPLVRDPLAAGRTRATLVGRPGRAESANRRNPLPSPDPG